MDNMTDYIAWLGDTDFDARPLGEVDALILCALSYYDMSPVLDPNGEPFYLKDRIEKISRNGLEIQITGGEQGLDAVLRAAAQSRRFGELTISNYVEQLEPEKDLQFSAVTFSWKDRFSFIAFRGTDNTLVGWKEDFMIAYTQTEAQKMALKYVQDSLRAPGYEKKGFWGRLRETFCAALYDKGDRAADKKAVKDVFAEEHRRSVRSGADVRAEERSRSAKAADPGARRWYIGGHSKGANLAIYAASQLTDEQLQLVERIFVLDGPGLAPDVMDPDLLSRIDDRAVRIIPEYSVIGRLMEPKLSDTRVIKSSNDGVMQHSIASWGIEHGGLALAEDQQPRDRWINEALRKWIDNMPYEARRPFVNDLFDALSAGGAKTVEELAGGGKDGLEAVYKGFKNISGSSKEILAELRKAAVSELKASVIDGAKKTLGNSLSSGISGIESLVKKKNSDGQAWDRKSN